jgi:hypothetical protein
LTSTFLAKVNLIGTTLKIAMTDGSSIDIDRAEWSEEADQEYQDR